MRAHLKLLVIASVVAALVAFAFYRERCCECPVFEDLDAQYQDGPLLAADFVGAKGPVFGTDRYRVAVLCASDAYPVGKEGPGVGFVDPSTSLYAVGDFMEQKVVRCDRTHTAYLVFPDSTPDRPHVEGVQGAVFDELWAHQEEVANTQRDPSSPWHPRNYLGVLAKKHGDAVLRRFLDACE